MTNNNNSPSESTLSGILVETVDEDSLGDDRTLQDEQLSEASSVGSVPLDADDLRPSDMTNLTSPTKCRALMTRTEGGQRILCCCGLDRETCRRRGHADKPDRQRAPPRWYEAFPNTRGQYRDICDGRLDRMRNGLTFEEMEAWRSTEVAEISRVAAALGGGTDTDDERTTVADDESDVGSTRSAQRGAPTPLRSLVSEMEDTMDEAIENMRRVTFGPDQHATTPITTNRTTDSQEVEGGSSLSTSAGAPDTAPEKSNTQQQSITSVNDTTDPDTCWYGLREANTQIRRICNTREDLNYWLSRRARMCRRFTTRTEAEEWLRNGDRDDDDVLWMGLERASGQRVATARVSELLARIGAGYRHVQTFSREEQAAMWVSEAVTSASPEVTVTGVRHGATAGRADSTKPRAPRRSGSSLSARSDDPESEPPGDKDLPWYGLVEPSEARVICNTREERDELIRKGLDWRATFRTLAEAEEWLRNAPPRPLKITIRRLPTPVHPTSAAASKAGMGASAASEGTRVPLSSSTSSETAGVPPTREDPSLIEIHADYAKYSGKDPSVGDNTRVYGIECSDVGPMEAALCPPGLDPAERSEFVERSLDVTALPGMYSVENYESVTSSEELAVSLLQQLDSSKRETLGHDGLWQTKRAHSLGYIKSTDDLQKVAKDVRKAWDNAWSAQKRRWSSYLFERRYSKLYIDEYLHYGLLPRIIFATYEYYTGLLVTARELLYSEGSTVKWKGSRAEALIQYHGEKLRQGRSYAANYRDHILWSYVYLRDAASKKDYRNEALLDPLWDRVHDLQQKLDEAGSSTDTNSSTGRRCGWCHRIGLHAEGQANCPGKVVSASQARKLLKGVPKTVGSAKIKQAFNELASRLTADPDGDVETIVTEIRSSHLGMT